MYHRIRPARWCGWDIAILDIGTYGPVTITHSWALTETGARRRAERMLADELGHRPPWGPALIGLTTASLGITAVGAMWL